MSNIGRDETKRDKIRPSVATTVVLYVATTKTIFLLYPKHIIYLHLRTATSSNYQQQTVTIHNDKKRPLYGGFFYDFIV